MRIAILCDDENRQLIVCGDEIHLNQYDLTEYERSKWEEKIRNNLCSLCIIRDDDDTVH